MVDRRLLAKSLKKHKHSGGRNYFRLEEGKNIIRIFPWDHELNRLDVVADRCDEDDVGRTVELFYADVTRLWVRGAGGGKYTNCLPNQETCPIWQEYWSLPGEKRQGRKPKPVFAINALDINNPQRGVRTLELPQSIFLGEINVKMEKIGIGILDYFLGFDPTKTEEQESDEDEESVGKIGTKLPKIAAHGEQMLGRHGRDIIIWLKKGAVGKNQDALLVNNDREHGGVVLRKETMCEDLPAHYERGVKDLWELPQYFPGYSTRSDNLWKHADEMVARFTAEEEEITFEKVTQEGDTSDEESPDGNGQEKVEKQKKETTEGADPDEDVEPSKEEKREEKVEKGDEQPEPDKPPKRRTRRPKKAIRIEKGSRVIWTDEWNDDNTQKLPKNQWKRFRGIFDRYDEKDGKVLCWVAFHPEDQKEGSKEQEIIQGAWDNTAESEIDRGGPFFKCAKDAVELESEE